MARANTNFDEKVRQYIANHHIQRFRNTDEFTGYPYDKTIIHEIFPGSDTRKRCFYVDDCIYFVSESSHLLIHRHSNPPVNLIINRRKFDYKTAIEYYYNLRLLVNTFDMKKARFDWKIFFENDCIGEIPLLKIIF